jgi:exonuclease III
VLRLVSWNIAGRTLWPHLRDLEADVALLQEARLPPADWAGDVAPSDSSSWSTAGYMRRSWRTAVVALSERVQLDPLSMVAVDAATNDADWIAACQGTVAAADVQVDGHTVLTAVSVYAQWESTRDKRVLYADASAHHILSDISRLIAPGHQMIIAGDWNILFGYGELGNTYFRDRYATVFDRAEALGLTFVGPQYPNGRQAKPWPPNSPRTVAACRRFTTIVRRRQPRPASSTSSSPPNRSRIPSAFAP